MSSNFFLVAKRKITSYAATIVACIIIVFIMVIVCVNYDSLSYDSYNNFINDWWPHQEYKWKWPDKQSNATATLCVWAFILLVCKIVEGIVVICSPYYTHQPSYKTYIITSSVLLVYIIVLLADLQSDLLASVIPGMFLNQFVGINKFCSILWIYNFEPSRQFLCLTMKFWLRLFTLFFSLFVPIVYISLSALLEIGFGAGYDFECFCYQMIIYIVLLIMFCVPISLGMGCKHRYCSMERWYKIMTIFSIIAVFIVWFGIIANLWDEWLLFSLWHPDYGFYFIYIFLWLAPIFNLILFVLLGLLAKSLPDLLKHEYSKNIMAAEVLNSIQNKLYIAFVYILFVLVILIQYLKRIFHSVTGPASLRTDFFNNVTILSLLSLILWFESPTLDFYLNTVTYIASRIFCKRHEPHLKCNKCYTTYLTKYKCKTGYIKCQQQQITCLKCSYQQHMHCHICGEPFISKYESEHSKICVVVESDELKEDLISELQSIAPQIHKTINCSTDNISQCEAVKRISQLSPLQIYQHLDDVYGDWNNVTVLNDYIHVVTEHKIQQLNEIMDDCKCVEYNYRRRQIYRSGNEDYIIKLATSIHSYVHHNIHKQQPIEEVSNELTQTDDRTINQYGFGSFIYYSLLKPKYRCFKTEMLNHITINAWTDVYQAVTHLMSTDKAKNIVSINNHNNVLKEQSIQFGDILSIKLYTDLDEAQGEFRKSFRKLTDDEDDKAVIERHVKKYYFWGRWLHHAIAIYGHTINNKEDVYYHGLDQKFSYPSLRADFNIPTSVSTEPAVALQFAGYVGVVLQIKSQWNSKAASNRSKALSVDWISRFPQEKEVLLFGSFNQLMIANICPSSEFDISKKRQECKLIVESINNFERLCKGINLNQDYNDANHANIMKILIENEMKKSSQSIDDFAGIFHNICDSKTVFSIKAFIVYHDDKPNVLKSLFDQLNYDNIHCNKCEVEMTRISNSESKNAKLKCIDCSASASWESEQHRCQYKLCAKCADMIQAISIILKRAHHVTDINPYDKVKMKALKIESLLEKRLL